MVAADESGGSEVKFLSFEEYCKNGENLIKLANFFPEKIHNKAARGKKYLYF